MSKISYDLKYINNIILWSIDEEKRLKHPNVALQTQRWDEFGWSDRSLPVCLVCTVVVGINKCDDALTFTLYWRQTSQQDTQAEKRCLIYSFQNSTGLWFSYNHSGLVCCCLLLASLFGFGESAAWSPRIVCDIPLAKLYGMFIIHPIAIPTIASIIAHFSKND